VLRGEGMSDIGTILFGKTPNNNRHKVLVVAEDRR
jgi:hypothetical protein